ncbi:NlpC/P60 family protein [Nonomuraea wenchangensis]|uniref:NlpC/P60 family protein n=2 Tax=Nonomuraea wenchangensis TaxID=568860 RepID=A0A1I0ERI9_9ACTN|nr:NlpC/P60 family protein [Nonomuraea wenchangensis]
MAALDGTVSRLDGRRADVRVDVDTAGAQAGMAATDASVSRVDGRTAHVQVDADVAGALAGIAAVSAALAALPAAAAVGLGAAGLAGAAVTAGVGIAALSAVAIPSLSRINEALKAQETAANSAARGLSNAAGATRNLVIEQAQAQIAQLQAANAADQLRQAQDRVKDAVAGVSQAKDRLKSAVQAAAQAQVSAAQRATSAERSLADAQRQALRAQEDLNRARAEAIKHLQDVARTLRGNALDQRQAALDLKEAEADLAKARRSGNADEIERASIAYERTQLRVEELKAEQERLNEEQAKGVEGNDRVVSAKEQVEAANRRVIDAERDLAKAYEEAGKAGEEAAKRVADARKAVRDAEDRVDDAKAALERVKRDQKIAKLQEKIRAEQAKQAAKQAARASATQATAAQKTADLSPAEQAAAQSIKAFKESYERFQKDLGTSVLPVITGGLKVIESLFKPLTPLIKGTADSLVGLEDSARKALGGPFWKDFFDQLSKQAPGVVEGLGKSFGNVIEGIAGIIRAFLPFSGTVVGGIEKATSAFATWGKNLQSNPGFQKFISFAQANIPKVVELFKNIGSAIGNIISALAPFGSAALSGLSALVGWIGKLSPSAIQAIALAIGGIVLGVKAWAIAQRVLNVVLSKNPIGLIITAIGLLVAGLTYAYQNSETFRSIVDAAFKAIGVAAQWLWTNVLQPVFNGLVWLWQNVIAPAATWLWQNVLKPAWDGIAAAIEWAWTNIIQPAIAALVLYWQTILGPVITWLYENVVKPAWDAISTAIQWAWQNIVKPAVAALVLYWQKVLGPVITWLWNNIVKPAWDGISAAVKFAWNNIIKPAVAALVLYWQTILGPAITWLWEKVIKPAWDAIGKGIKVAWENVIQPAVKALWTFVTDTLPKGFKSGVELIGKFWDSLKSIAAKPVEFMVNTVYNNGIRAVWNAVAKALKLSELPELKFSGFAKGGIYPGYTPGRDVGVAAVSGGEAIMRPEWTRAVGSDYVHQANAAARRGGVSGVQRFMGAFAGGGIVGDILAQGVKLGAEKILNPILDRASAAMGDNPFAQMLVNVPKVLVKGVIDFLTAEEAKQGGPGAAKALAFARAQIGKDYEFGATGPNTFDCSGLTMRAWQAAGRSDIPRTSQQQMGWVKPISAPVPGALGFPHPGHVWMYSGPNTIVEAPQTGLKVREVAARAAQVIGVPPTEYDSGGYLPTGHSLVYNGTGSPEPVLTDQQWQSMQGATRGGDGPLFNIDQFNATPEQSPGAIARELYWLSKARPR